MNVPMSIRLYTDEEKYQVAKLTEQTVPLEMETSIREWEYWRLIDNRFPYTLFLTIHHMLVPKRVFARLDDATPEERLEFNYIFQDLQAERHYDFFMQNFPVRQSIPEHLHYHLGKYYTSRKELCEKLRLEIKNEQHYETTGPGLQSN